MGRLINLRFSRSASGKNFTVRAPSCKRWQFLPLIKGGQEGFTESVAIDGELQVERNPVAICLLRPICIMVCEHLFPLTHQT
jgi:hypothetical protein